MYLIYSLVLVTVLTLIFSDLIRKYSKIFYGLASSIAGLVMVYEIFRLTNNLKLEGFMGNLEKVFMKGNVSISFFVLVMFAGALNKKWNVTKKLLSVRAEIAILGSILIIPHCVMYAVRFINKLIVGKPITIFYIVYLLIGLIGFCIMIPLFITSFKKVRAKMSYKEWKKLQKLAYPFYFIAYIHIVLALLNNKLDWVKLITYTALFIGYFILKIVREKKQWDKFKYR
ncbi:sulfite oxidase heme-binding subunit YedZ [Clostridium botulinum]|uniref:ferric reductase-like transmembrane domain-containing protein n=1 Tax=Clostridium sp. CH2 TaxID=2949990 RepID=UPI001D8BBF35|nr:ferric reductase-like transmembrane domain-containing protein [Clostridium sp. CH2]MBN1044759.1 sulfite oxidase heme-binding subunit YedZ [Clostridium botulinum]